MKKGIIAAIIVVVVIVVGVVYANSRPKDDQNNNQDTTSQQNNDNTNVSGAAGQGETKTFTVTGKPFSFTPAEIRVKRGDRVKIVFNNAEGFHDWVIDEFNARTPQINAGQTAEVTFTADRVGTFEYYCSVGTHRQMGMKGNLIVE